MTYEELNGIPRQIHEKTLSLKEAVDLLATEFYNFPFRYGIFARETEDRGDMVMTLLERLPSILNEYMASKNKDAPFALYFHSRVGTIITSWRRRKRNDYYSEMSLLYSSIGSTENKADKYKNMEYSQTLASEATLLHYTTDKKVFDTKEPLSIGWKEKTVFQKSIIILALKSCYYLKDSDIIKICAIIGCDSSYFAFLIQKLRQELENKIERRDIYESRRSYPFYLKCRYMLQLQRRNADTAGYEKLKKQLSQHIKKWQRYTAEFKNNQHKICPSNMRIGKLIGISQRQVCHYIKYIQETWQDDN